MVRPRLPFAALQLLLVLACAGGARLVFAQVNAAEVEFVRGSASIISADGRQSDAHVNDHILEGDTVVTGAGAELHALTADHGYLVFRPDTRAKILQFRADGSDQDSFSLSLLKGALRSITGWIGKRNPRNYSISTPTATIGVRGTDHEPSYVPPEDRREGVDAGTYDKVNTGATVLKNSVGEVIVHAGEVAFTPHGNGAPPVKLARHPAFYRPSADESRIEERKHVVEHDYEEHLQQRRKELQERKERDEKSRNSNPPGKSEAVKEPAAKPSPRPEGAERERSPHRIPHRTTIGR